MQEGQGGDGEGFEVELLGDDLLHALQVRGGEAALPDANQLVGGREVALLLRHLGRHVEAAEADARQVLGLDLQAETQKTGSHGKRQEPPGSVRAPGGTDGPSSWPRIGPKG